MLRDRRKERFVTWGDMVPTNFWSFRFKRTDDSLVFVATCDPNTLAEMQKLIPRSQIHINRKWLRARGSSDMDLQVRIPRSRGKILPRDRRNGQGLTIRDLGYFGATPNPCKFRTKTDLGFVTRNLVLRLLRKECRSRG